MCLTTDDKLSKNESIFDFFREAQGTYAENQKISQIRKVYSVCI